MNEAGVTICINLPLTALAQIGVEQLTALASLFALAVPDAPIAATAPAKAAVRRASPTQTNHWATAAVKETLVRMYPCSDPFYDTETIREAMRACGGPPLPAWSTIGVYAIQTLHLRRGKAPARPPRVAKARDRVGRPTTLRAVEPVAPFVAPTAAPGIALPPVDAAWDRIQSEALRQGFELRSHSDLPMFNRARIARGESPFALKRAAAMKPKGNGFAVMSDWR
jgi:hypothetical protein